MNDIIALAVFILIMLFFYKVYVQDLLQGDTKLTSIVRLGRGIFSSRYLMPIDDKAFDEKHKKKIQNANQALRLFWIVFLVIILLAISNKGA